ncbi:MAG TPA: hypothetical protein VGS57_17285 [Thermoanaerobaculia bacterium]|nr:hypothetical protein [Thermoanaerobaculia bacterium]
MNEPEPTLRGGAEAAETAVLTWAPRREALLIAALSLLASLVTCRAVWLSDFTEIPGDAYDGRLNAFFLEHSWGWLTRRPVDASFWGLPMFFPHGGNALAYSDLMASFGPLYWPWRAIGLQPDVSFALWTMAVFAVGAAAAYLLLRRAVGLSVAAAGVGAWLIACSASRIHQVSHAQLLPVFYVCAGLAGVLGWARAESVAKRRGAAVMAAVALVAQLYGGFYQGFFLAVAVVVLVACALLMRQPRAELLRRLRADWLLLLAIGGATALALWPWAAHYRAAQAVVGPRDWEAIVPMVPRPATWLYMTPRALLYRWTRHADVFRSLPWEFEHAVGLGFLTTAAVLAAAWQGSRRTAVRVTIGATAVLIAATTMMDGHSFWRHLVEAVPSMGAARAVCRVGLLLPIGAAVVLGTWADSLRGRARTLALVLLVVCAAEQLAGLDTHDRDVQRRWESEVARRVDRHAAAFVVSRSSDRGGAMLVHLDAMFAAQRAGVPTVNGASGSEPPLWLGLQWARVRNEEAARAYRGALGDWLRSGGVDPARVQWIQLPPNFRGAEGLQRPPRRTRPRREPAVEPTPAP